MCCWRSSTTTRLHHTLSPTRYQRLSAGSGASRALRLMPNEAPSTEPITTTNSFFLQCGVALSVFLQAPPPPPPCSTSVSFLIGRSYGTLREADVRFQGSAVFFSFFFFLPVQPLTQTLRNPAMGDAPITLICFPTYLNCCGFLPGLPKPRRPDAATPQHPDNPALHAVASSSGSRASELCSLLPRHRFLSALCAAGCS